MSFAAVIERLQRLQNPYPGLRPFETQESHLFFGRDQQVAELVARLERNQFLAVLGMSGSGKSSLVRAGLVPALERGRASGGAGHWRMVVTHPAGAPFESLAVDLQKAGFDTATLRENSHGLVRVAKQLQKDESLLVVVDQFEELFRYKDLDLIGEEARRRQAADAAEFVQLLLASSRHHPPVFIVITMRSDYLGDCGEFRDLPETLNECQYLVPRMTREQRKEAIEGPLGGVEIAPSVVQRMLNDAGDQPDQLPVLQHALMRTWAHWRSAYPDRQRPIELLDYEAIGGFEVALNLHADELLAGVPPDYAATIFKRLTARARGSRDRRDPATLADLWAVCQAETLEEQARVTGVIDHFRRGEATFLAPQDAAIGPDTYIDITHESLIRQWGRLRDRWVPEERRSATTYLELVQRATRWKANEAELLSGLDLSEAVAWDRNRNKSAAWAAHYADASALPRVEEFIAASQRQERRRKFKERSLWVTGPLALLFIALAGAAAYQWRSASQLGTVLLARQLAAQSQLIQTEEINLEPAVLVAVESLRRSPTAEGNRALRQSMARLPRQVALQHSGPVTTVSFSSDGRHVATVSGGIVRSFEGPNWQEVSRPGATATRGVLAFSPNGRWLAFSSDPNVVKVLEVESGKETARVPTSGSIRALALSADGLVVATIEVDDDRDNAVLVYDVVSSKQIAKFADPFNRILSVALSATGRWVAVGSGGAVDRDYAGDRDADTARVLDVATGKEVSRLPHLGGVGSVAFSADDKWVVTGSDDKTARVLDSLRGNEVVRLTHPEAVNSVAFSRDGRWVATGSGDRTARVFDATNGTEVARLVHRKPVTAVVFSPDGSLVATASDEDTNARVFETTSGKDVTHVTGPYPVTSVSFSADGQRVAIGSADFRPSDGSSFTGARARVLRAPDWKEIFRFEPKGVGFQAVAISADGRHIVIGGDMGPTRMFNVESGNKELQSIQTRAAPLSVAVSSDGRLVATRGLDSAAIWLDGKEVAHVDGPVVQSLAQSANGRWLVVGTGDEGGTARVFDLGANDGEHSSTAKAWKEVRRLTQHGPVVSAAISNDGRWVATSTGDQLSTTRMFETSGKEVWTVQEESSINSIGFTDDGALIAVGGPNKALRVLETKSGTEVVSRLLLGGAVRAMRFVANGRYLLTASDASSLNTTNDFVGANDVVITRHLLALQDLIDDACSRVTRNLTDGEWRKYVGDEVPYRTTCPEPSVKLGR